MTATPATKAAEAESPSPPRPPFVLDLDAAVGRDAAELVGGKAARLALARGRSFPVPGGFVVTTAAFRALLETPAPASAPAVAGAGEASSLRGGARTLGETVARRIAGLDGADLARTRALALEIEAAFLATPFPAEVERAVRDTYRRLGAPCVAVRSSAPAEDGDARSLAGQFDSFLDVRGEADLLDRVRRCFASLFSERALALRARTPEIRKPGEAPAMAVLVQEMVHADLAGILFTREPLAAGPDRMVVEVGRGLGSDVASGLVTPSRFALDPRARRAGHLGGDRSTADLPVPVVEALADLGTRAEAFFGAPQDIEWAARDGRVYLLQSRPITAGAAATAARAAAGVETGTAEADAGDLCDLWTAANAQEALDGPVTPLTFSYFQPLIERGRARAARLLGIDDPPGEYLRVLDGRVYFNVRYFRDFLARVPGIPPTISDKLIFGEDLSPELVFPRPTFDLRLARVALVVLRAWWGATGRLDKFVDQYRRRIDELATVAVKQLEDRAAIAHLGRVSRLVEKALNHHVLGTAVAGSHYLLLGAALRALDVGGGENAADELVAAVPGMETARSSAAVYALADEAGRRPAVRALFLATAPGDVLAKLHAVEGGAEWKAALDRFLAEFGHRAVEEAELAAPRWREDPTFILGTVRCALEAGVERAPLAAEASARQRKRAIARTIGAELASRSRLERFFPVRRTLFRWLWRAAERVAPYRENLRFHALAGIQMVREVYVDFGRRLAHRKYLKDAADVFHLTAAEVEAALARLPAGPAKTPAEVAALAARRRGEWLEAAKRPAPRFVSADGRPIPGPAPVAAAALGRPGFPPGVGDARAYAGPAAGAPPDLASRRYLEGVPVSGGFVTGPVRKVEKLDEAYRVLKPGDILLARAATPSWTPLFFIARGVILDLGGLLSHSAVVAREYGIPCVVGVKSATEVLSDGDIVTLDAHRGRVYLPAR